MSFVLTATFLLQQLGVAPYPAESGTPITITVRGAAGEPLAALPVAVATRGGAAAAAGITDGNGELRVAAGEPGDYVWSADAAGIRLVAPHVVVAAPRRWLYGLACVPLGLALLWRLLRPPSRAAQKRDQPRTEST